MKLSKNFCWDTFQRAAMNRQLSFITDGWKYDIIYVADGYMMANKRRPNTADIITPMQIEALVTAEDINIANMVDGTPLIIEDGEYKPLPLRGKNK